MRSFKNETLHRYTHYRLSYRCKHITKLRGTLLLEINYKQGHFWLVVGNPSVTDDVNARLSSLFCRRWCSGEDPFLVRVPVILLLIASRRMRRPSDGGRESTLLMMIRSRASRPPVIICCSGSFHLHLFGPVLFVH